MVYSEPKRFIIQMDEFISQEMSSHARKMTQMTQNIIILYKMCHLCHFSR